VMYKPSKSAEGNGNDVHETLLCADVESTPAGPTGVICSQQNHRATTSNYTVSSTGHLDGIRVVMAQQHG
jgi:hypothetical protein